MKKTDKLIVKDVKIPGFPEDATGRARACTVTMQLRDSAAEDAATGLCGEIAAFLAARGRKMQSLSRIEMEKIVHRLLIDYPQVEGVTLSVAGSAAYGGQEAAFEVEIERTRHTVYIGIGSNVGDREKNIREAVGKVDAPEDTRLVEVSKIYETEPVGYVDQDRFLNAVCKIQTLASPENLVSRLQEIEKSLKRERNIRWGPRTIDLDVLFYDDLVTDNEKIIIPHPRLHERLFVLKPLCDISPYLVHPILKERCYTIMESLENDEPDPVERGSLD